MLDAYERVGLTIVPIVWKVPTVVANVGFNVTRVLVEILHATRRFV